MESTNHLHMHRRRSGRVAALLALALASGSLGAGALSLAIFTDTQAVTGNAFSTGTIDIATTPASALFAVTGMFPGDVRTAAILVENTGTGALRYAITTTVASGAALAGQLQASVHAGATCTGGALYSGALAAVSVGSNAQGGHAGDRTLAGLASETLCFRVELPLATGNAFQNTSTSVTFTFDAEQTANNP
jgi:hypothetical protein